MMRTVRTSIFMAVVLFGGLLLPINSATAATAQKISYSIMGDCVDYYDETGEYAFFEEEPDWSCYIMVKLSPTKPVRTARLQWWSGRKWQQESSSKTDAKGYAYLDFDPYCEGQYCDGEWKYRVFVDTASGQKSNTSRSFYVTFYPGTASENW